MICFFRIVWFKGEKYSHCQETLPKNIASKHDKKRRENFHTARNHYQRTLPANMIKREEKVFTLPGIIVEEHYQKNIAKEHCQQTLPKNTARDHHRRTLPANIIREHCCGDGKWIHYLV